MSDNPVNSGNEADTPFGDGEVLKPIEGPPLLDPASIPPRMGVGMAPLPDMPPPADALTAARQKLVTYQATFIQAQAGYIHTKDVRQITEAQHGFIIDLLEVLELVSVSELGEAQEQLILLLSDKLSQLGVV